MVTSEYPNSMLTVNGLGNGYLLGHSHSYLPIADMPTESAIRNLRTIHN